MNFEDWPVSEESEEEPPQQPHVAGMIIAGILVLAIFIYFLVTYLNIGVQYAPSVR